VINDEAHHCYRERPTGDGDGEAKAKEKLTAEERQGSQGQQRGGAAVDFRHRGGEAQGGLRAVYDLSATPFFLRGSGYEEGTLFPWVVSDFALIDAIECGIVKLPRVPVSDNAVNAGRQTQARRPARMGMRIGRTRFRADRPRRRKGHHHGQADRKAGGECMRPATASICRSRAAMPGRGSTTLDERGLYRRPGWRWLRCARRRASALAAPAAAGWIRRAAGRLRQLPACRRDTPDAGALVFRGFNCHTVRCVSPRIVARAAAPLQPQASKLTMSLQRDSEEAPHTRPQQPHRARRLHVDVNQAQQGSRASAAALDGRH
jgi:hypothetical protein